MQVKPLRGEFGHPIECTAFLEEMARSGYDLEVALAIESPVSPSVELENRQIGASNNEQRRRLYLVQRDVREIRPGAS